MGIRIDIEWDFISPSLGCISGIVKIWDIESIYKNAEKNYNKLILTYICKKDRHSIGFSAIDRKGIPSKTLDLFNVFDGTLKTMINSYYKGMILDKNMFHWIEDSLTPEGVSFKEWAKTKGYEEGA